MKGTHGDAGGLELLFYQGAIIAPTLVNMPGIVHEQNEVPDATRSFTFGNHGNVPFASQAQAGKP